MNNKVRILFLSLLVFVVSFIVFDYNVRIKTFSALVNKNNSAVQTLPETTDTAAADSIYAKDMNRELSVLSELTGSEYEARIKDASSGMTVDNYKTVAQTLLSTQSDIEQKAIAIDLLSRAPGENSKSILQQFINSNLYQDAETDLLLKNQAQEALDQNEINR